MEDLVAVFVPIAICVVLPIMIVWLVCRSKANETNKRAEIILAVINANSNVDVEEILRKLEPETARLTVKERMLKKLNSALVRLGVGMGCLGLGIYTYLCYADMNLHLVLFVVGVIFALIGIANLIMYFVTKRTMATELEAEEQAAAEKIAEAE